MPSTNQVSTTMPFIYFEPTSDDILFSEQGTELMWHSGNQHFKLQIDYIFHASGRAEKIPQTLERILLCLKHGSIKRSCLRYDGRGFFQCTDKDVMLWLATVVYRRLAEDSERSIAAKKSRTEAEVIRNLPANQSHEEAAVRITVQVAAFPHQILQRKQMDSNICVDSRSMNKAKHNQSNFPSSGAATTSQQAQFALCQQHQFWSPPVTAVAPRKRKGTLDFEKYVDPTEHDVIITDSKREMMSRLGHLRFVRFIEGYVKEYQATAVPLELCSLIFRRVQQLHPPVRFLRAESVSGRHCVCHEDFATMWIHLFLDRLARNADGRKNPEASAASDDSNSLQHEANPFPMDRPVSASGEAVPPQASKPPQVGASISSTREETSIGVGSPDGSWTLPVEVDRNYSHQKPNSPETERPGTSSESGVPSQATKPSHVGASVSKTGEETSIGADRSNHGSLTSPIEIDDDDDNDDSYHGTKNSQDLVPGQGPSHGIADEHKVFHEEEEYDEEEYEAMEKMNRAMEMGLEEGCSTDDEED